MGKHHRPTLIRAWVDNYVQLPFVFACDWEEGLDGFAQFSLPRENDLFRAMRKHGHKVGFSVASASAAEWWLDSAHYDKSGVRIICISRDAHARRCMLPDDALIHMWLDAEKRYLEAA